MTDKVSVTREVRAPADKVWEMVADVTRMGEWSPETVEGRWLDGATQPAAGARFRGSNRRGPRRWSTIAKVTVADRGEEFTFVVSSVGLPVSEWSYAFESSDAGCRVTETWTDRRSWVVKVGGAALTGVGDRAEHNREGMEETLRRLAAAAEGSPVDG
jgi:hypothetical protein